MQPNIKIKQRANNSGFRVDFVLFESFQVGMLCVNVIRTKTIQTDEL